jgi:hypothetical protein
MAFNIICNIRANIPKDLQSFLSLLGFREDLTGKNNRVRENDWLK